MQRTCACGDGRGYKANQALQKHQNTAGHKRKCDPEFAAAEEADKAANKASREAEKLANVARGRSEKAANKAVIKATRGDKEKVRKAGEKETARKAGEKETARKAGKKEKERLATRSQHDNNI